MLLNNNLYKIKYIYTILIFWKCPYRRVRSIAASRLTKNSPPDCFCLYEAVPYLPNSTGNCWNLILGGLRMTCECVIALVTCVVTIITTVIAVLSYLKDKKE